MKYTDFLKNKIAISENFGFDIDQSEINPMLKPHQKDIVQWALKGGCRAMFASFGLGKSFMQLECMRLIQKREGGKQLIIAPLGVRQEFKIDAVKLDIEIKFIRRTEELTSDGLYITNYESVRDGRLDVNEFNGCSLDEASVLRSYGSKTYQTFLSLFESIKYKFVATATPSPNKYKELIHYAGFLGVMDTGAALTRFFKRDSTQANNLTIHPHKETEFWLWLSSWAVFVQRPSDLGYSDEGYDLPKLNIHYHEVQSGKIDRVDKRDGQRMMFGDASLSLSAASQEKRNSLGNRVEQIRSICYDLRKSFNLKGFDNDTGRQEGISQGVLQEEQGKTDRGSERENESKQEGCEEIPNILLREEQRIVIGKTEDKGEKELFGKKGVVLKEVKDLGEKQPREDERTPKKLEGKEQRPLETIQKESLQCEQGTNIISGKGCKIEKIRTDSGHVRGYDDKTKGCMHDMRNGERSERAILSSCGSLPQDRESERSSLSSLQFGSGSVQRQCGFAHESEGLPDQIVIWCDQNIEQKAIEKMLKEEKISYVSLYGNTKIDDREKELKQWLNKEKTVFLSKPSMYGSGINMQQCHTTIFAGIGFKFNSFIQAIHRVHRFQQLFECDIHIIYAQSEIRILEILKKKWKQHDIMVEKMTKIIKEYGLSQIGKDKILQRSMGIKRVEAKGKNFIVANNDCVDEAKLIESDSVGLICSSIPFSDHYEYSPSYNDFGHTDGNDHFWKQMDYITPELYRILKPGRIFACHTKDRILFGNVTGKGMPTVSPFHMEAAFHAMKHGFDYIGMITVVTDVVRENNQTYRLGWTEQCKDGTKMGVGSPEYILLLRKPQTDRTKGYADEPVKKKKGDFQYWECSNCGYKITDEKILNHAHRYNIEADNYPGNPFKCPECKEAVEFNLIKNKDEYSRARWQTDAHAFWRSSGDRHVDINEIASLTAGDFVKEFKTYDKGGIYNNDEHIKIGEKVDESGRLPSTFMSIAPNSKHENVWTDVNRMLTLNTSQVRRKQNMHICPLQFDIVDRLITRYSNKDDLVFDPFGGLMTVPLRAIKLGRKGRASELNPDYFRDGVKYLELEEKNKNVPSLFEYLEKME